MPWTKKQTARPRRIHSIVGPAKRAPRSWADTRQAARSSAHAPFGAMSGLRGRKSPHRPPNRAPTRSAPKLPHCPSNPVPPIHRARPDKHKPRPRGARMTTPHRITLCAPCLASIPWPLPPPKAIRRPKHGTAPLAGPIQSPPHPRHCRSIHWPRLPRPDPSIHPEEHQSASNPDGPHPEMMLRNPAK